MKPSHLNQVLHAYNTSDHESTGRAPFEVVFGRNDRSLHDLDYNSKQVTPGSFVDQLKRTSQQIQRLVREHNDSAHAHQERNYNRHKNERHEFNVGDRVLLTNHQKRVGQSKSLVPKHIGPYKIVARNHLNYTIQDNNNIKQVIHFNRMRPFHKPSHPFDLPRIKRRGRPPTQQQQSASDGLRQQATATTSS